MLLVTVFVSGPGTRIGLDFEGVTILWSCIFSKLKYIVFDCSEGLRTLGRLGRRWEDNIKMDLKNTEWEDMDWIYLAQNRDHWWAVMNVVMGKVQGLS
jgi:hypothetical protein